MASEMAGHKVLLTDRGMDKTVPVLVKGLEALLAGAQAMEPNLQNRTMASAMKK